jgi:hypothetical protein
MVEMPELPREKVIGSEQAANKPVATARQRSVKPGLPELARRGPDDSPGRACRVAGRRSVDLRPPACARSRQRRKGDAASATGIDDDDTASIRSRGGADAKVLVKVCGLAHALGVKGWARSSIQAPPAAVDSLFSLPHLPDVDMARLPRPPAGAGAHVVASGQRTADGTIEGASTLLDGLHQKRFEGGPDPFGYSGGESRTLLEIVRQMPSSLASSSEIRVQII